jgi:hypothetical protein
MPRNICQSARLLDAASSPCVTCADRERCPIALLHGQLQRAEAAKPTYKRSIVSYCSDYARAGDPASFAVDVRGSLAEHGVSDLCDGCEERASGECEERAGLDALVTMARATYGITVEFATFCCSVKRGLPLLPVLP